MGEGLRERGRPCRFDAKDGRGIEGEDVLLAPSKSGHLILMPETYFFPGDL
jgi:hypothetical protein